VSGTESPLTPALGYDTLISTMSEKIGFQQCLGTAFWHYASPRNFRTFGQLFLRLVRSPSNPKLFESNILELHPILYPTLIKTSWWWISRARFLLGISETFLNLGITARISRVLLLNFLLDSCTSRSEPRYERSVCCLIAKANESIIEVIQMSELRSEVIDSTENPGF
jgi:hypothetical protein